MSNLTQKDFDKQFGEIISRIQKQVTPFPNDTTAKKVARVKRASSDPFFFSVTYFPHYIRTEDEYREIWKTPDEKVDWVKAGFANCHSEFFKTANLLQIFSLLAAYRESGKDTLLGLIDPIFKLVTEDENRMRWFVTVMAMTQTKSEGKIIPIKLELEKNVRLRNDFGDQVGKTKWENDYFVLANGRAVKSYGREQSMRGESNFGHRPDHIMLNDVNDPTKPDSPGVVNKFINSVKMDILPSVNSPRWSALYLCNYTVKGDIVDELLTGKNTKHYNKRIFRKLVPNNKECRGDQLIARQCVAAGFNDTLKSDWEFRHPTVQCLTDQKNDPETFDCESQMHPRNPKDQRFKDSYFRYHTQQEVRSGKYIFYTAVDPTSTSTGDGKAVISLGIGTRANGMLHMPVVKADIQQQSIDWMLETSWRHFELFKMKILAVEENSYKDFVRREYLRLMGKKRQPLPFKPIQQSGSKVERIDTLVYLIKEGIMTFDLDDPDQEILIRQLKAHPTPGSIASGGLGDDGPDALATCKQIIDQYPPGYSEVGYESLSKREAQFGDGTW
jgi:hypothetical protein